MTSSSGAARSYSTPRESDPLSCPLDGQLLRPAVTAELRAQQSGVCERARGGGSDKEVAHLLGVSVTTVREHLGRLYRCSLSRSVVVVSEKKTNEGAITIVSSSKRGIGLIKI